MSKIRLTLRVYDGKKVDPKKLEVEKECHSWDLQFLPQLMCFCAVPPVTQYYEVGHNLKTLSAGQMSIWGVAIPGVGTVTHGIIVGTGTGVESPTDYAIGSIIGHGTAANQLSYGAGTFTEPAVSGTTSVFKFARVFTNSSPTNPITVKEFAIYCYNQVAFNFCMSRDLTGDVNIANGGASKTIEVTVTVDNTS